MLSDSYIDYICDVKRYSPRTCEIYSAVLREFSDFCEAEDDDTLISVLTPAMVRNYEVHLMDERGENPRTVGLHLSVLSGFAKFLMKDGHLNANPVRLVTRPKTSKRNPSFYRNEAMDAYFEATDHVADREALDTLMAFGGSVRTDKTAVEMYRARLRRLIVSLLAGTGMRRSELIGLTVGSVDMGRKVVKVLGKGDKAREIPLISSLCQEISLYLQSVDTMVGSVRTASDPLLVTEKGAKLYPVYVDRAVKQELGNEPGITGRKSPHVLRHTLATELLNNGTDLYSIKELLGHSSLAATQVYTHNSIEKLKTVYNNAHPRAKNGGNNGHPDQDPQV